jgi:REP-associated tyrosine transposase
MPRRSRFSTAGYVFHVLNRAVARQRLFQSDGDYDAFVRVLDEARRKVPMRLLAFAVMPNHWHLVLWPEEDDALSEFMRWLTVSHAQRWHAAHGTAGTGSLYQGRFKSFPVQEDEHFLTVCRYVERNPLRANLVSRAELWKWSSLWTWNRAAATVPLAKWPVPRPADWVEQVNAPQTEAELNAVRRSVVRSRPFGDGEWTLKTAKSLGLEQTLRIAGRTRD